MSTQQNTFTTFLELLKVKHTRGFSNKFYNEHPHKNNLFGLSKMLSDYGVENGGIMIPDKNNDISEIETPFIAQFSGDFVVVDNVDANKVSFLWKGMRHAMQVDKFVLAWTGIALIAEASCKSGEPDYMKHRKAELIELLKKIAFFSACGLILLIAGFISLSGYSVYRLLGYSFLLILNLAGLYVSWLLLLKQMSIDSQYFEKICSLFKQRDCNNILESEAAKLFGVVGWSEIGLGYFLTNVLILFFTPVLITYIALINLFTLPYAFWSIWYQKVKAKQWCALCMLVQFFLWAIFIVNLLWGYIPIPFFDNNPPLSIFIFQLIAVGSCYIAAIFGINILVPKLSTEKTVRSLKQSIDSMKADEAVFEALLKQQQYLDIDDCDSVIRFGNPGSKLRITVFSNLYCNPCAKMHKRIEDLLQQVKNEISVMYILSSFEESLNSTNKYMMAACLANPCPSQNGDTRGIIQILSDWFEKGKLLRDEYFKDMNLDMDNPEIEIEFQRHEVWKEKSQLRATPTIFVNGYQLPESYKIEDLRYFTDLDL